MQTLLFNGTFHGPFGKHWPEWQFIQFSWIYVRNTICASISSHEKPDISWYEKQWNYPHSRKDLSTFIKFEVGVLKSLSITRRLKPIYITSSPEPTTIICTSPNFFEWFLQVFYHSKFKIRTSVFGFGSGEPIYFIPFYCWLFSSSSNMYYKMLLHWNLAILNNTLI